MASASKLPFSMLFKIEIKFSVFAFLPANVGDVDVSAWSNFPSSEAISPSSTSHGVYVLIFGTIFLAQGWIYYFNSTPKCQRIHPRVAQGKHVDRVKY